MATWIVASDRSGVARSPGRGGASGSSSRRFSPPPGGAGGPREPGLRVGPADDLDDEIEKRGLVHQLRPVMARIREEVLQPRPVAADGPEQQAPDETPKPPVHCLPRPEVDRQPPALRARWRMVFHTSRRSTEGWRPRRTGRGSSGSIRAHSSSVRSDGERFVLRASSAIRPHVSRGHISSLNHPARAMPRHSQTVT